MPPIRRSTYLLAAITLAAFAFSLVWKPAPPPAFVGIRSSDVPETIGTWRSQGDYEVSQEVRDALSSADIVSRTYTLPGASNTASPIDFVLIGGTDRSALHDPRSCLVGAGWRLEDDHAEILPHSGVSARACRAVGQPDSPGFDIVYLYVVDGQIRNAVTEIRAEMLMSALLGRKNRPVYFMRVIIPLAADANTRAANHKQLIDFADAAWGILGSRIGHGG